MPYLDSERYQLNIQNQPGTWDVTYSESSGFESEILSGSITNNKLEGGLRAPNVSSDGFPTMIALSVSTRGTPHRSGNPIYQDNVGRGLQEFTPGFDTDEVVYYHEATGTIQTLSLIHI